jgi:hypothetical protein
MFSSLFPGVVLTFLSTPAACSCETLCPPFGARPAAGSRRSRGERPLPHPRLSPTPVWCAIYVWLCGVLTFLSTPAACSRETLCPPFGARPAAGSRIDPWLTTSSARKMLTFPFVGTLAYMSDALPIMCKFSLLTQKSAADVDLEVFSRHLPLLTDVLEHLADNVAPNSHYANLAATLTTLQQDEQDGGPGLEIKNRGVQDANWLEGARKQFHLRLAAHLTSRFPEHELMSSLYVILNADRYPDDRRELHTYLEPHLKRVLDHYCKVNRVKKKKVTVIPNRREAEDSFMPGLSGAGGLAGHIHCHYRGKTKLSSVSDEQPQLTPETMLNNPFYFKTKTKAKEKKDSRDIRVPWAVRDICRAILKNRAECKLF